MFDNYFRGGTVKRTERSREGTKNLHYVWRGGGRSTKVRVIGEGRGGEGRGGGLKKLLENHNGLDFVRFASSS